MRDGEAPSYYNPVEASTLVKLLQGLLSYKTAGGQGVSVQDIGVIATYRNQVSEESGPWAQMQFLGPVVERVAYTNSAKHGSCQC